MRLNSKAAVFIAAATLVLATSAATAFAAAAAQEQVALQVGSDMGTGYTGTYGTDITLAPAVMSKIELPGDKFHFQAYVSNVDSMGVSVGMQWLDFRDFEDIQLEDTNTVPAFGYAIGADDAVILGDGSVVTPTFPYLIRAEYKPLGSSTAPATFSETETVSIIKEDSTKVTIAPSKTVRHAGMYFTFTVAPNCGVSTVRVTVSKSGMKSVVYNPVTNEDGIVTAKLKLGTKNGTYKVSAKFLGNIYGVASATASKNIKATR
ncbi:MAG TPA: hypothetical protein VIK83_04420 [Coriobacteriia bacterium]